MGESRRLDNARMKRELLFQLRYPTLFAGLAAVRERTHRRADNGTPPVSFK
jgi:hypothetical protein